MFISLFIIMARSTSLVHIANAPRRKNSRILSSSGKSKGGTSQEVPLPKTPRGEGPAKSPSEVVKEIIKNRDFPKGSFSIFHDPIKGTFTVLPHPKPTLVGSVIKKFGALVKGSLLIPLAVFVSGWMVSVVSSKILGSDFKLDFTTLWRRLLERTDKDLKGPIDNQPVREIREPKSRKRWWYLASLLVPILAGIFLWIFGFPSIPRRPSTDDSYQVTSILPAPEAPPLPKGEVPVTKQRDLFLPPSGGKANLFAEIINYKWRGKSAPPVWKSPESHVTSEIINSSILNRGSKMAVKPSLSDGEWSD
jgi:hypothetical protein